MVSPWWIQCCCDVYYFKKKVLLFEPNAHRTSVRVTAVFNSVPALVVILGIRGVFCPIPRPSIPAARATSVAAMMDRREKRAITPIARAFVELVRKPVPSRVRVRPSHTQALAQRPFGFPSAVAPPFHLSDFVRFHRLRAAVGTAGLLTVQDVINLERARQHTRQR